MHHRGGGKKTLQDTFFNMLIMKTFSSYLSLLCVYWSSRAASGKSRGGLFRKGGSSDAVALERISVSVCVCMCMSAFSLRGCTVYSCTS